MPGTVRGGDATRRRRRIRTVILSVFSIFICALVAGLPVYVLPQVDQPRSADAILILGGPDYRRYGFGFGLGAEGWAPDVVVSNPNGAEDPYLTEYCASRHPEFNLICFVPDPPTTKGEGRELRRLAEQHGWRRVMVVTIRPHISRARFILEQCFDGELVMVAIPARLSPFEWMFHYVYQTAGYARASLQPGC
ncbi:YdcF family protein [Mycolicibacterium goodii]|uniref:YdcF family protein n=1 Tax=Mycolicibacterium goodii TaxID=134601 RepID=UPI001F04F4AE|nr:YdcF family protein [Mycolicibacterium goodii]ULN47015.1 YdcF family protein [Mycolicibacterium goodii]